MSEKNQGGLTHTVDWGRLVGDDIKKFWPIARTHLSQSSGVRIFESNSYFSIRFDSKRVQIFEIFEYLPSPISYFI